MNSAIHSKQTISGDALKKLRYLFLTFFKIGLVSFGGHMALIAVIQREMVEKDKSLDEEVIIDALSIASLLPGPVAVNVVAYIGHHLQGKRGAAVSMLGILLPACSLMLLLSWFYFNYAYRGHLSELMIYTAGTVSAIILSTGINLYNKEIHGNKLKMILCAAAIGISYFCKGYLVTIGLIGAGGLIGFLAHRPASTKSKTPAQHRIDFKLSNSHKLTLFVLGLLELSFLTNAANHFNSVFLKISSVFSGISLSLFGGGYVMVPIMQSLLVGELKWITNQQFADSITFSQVTPGPILISALFVGYKLAGIMGGLIAICAIFIPSAALMLVISTVFKRNKQHQTMKNILGGIKPVVVGLIIISSLKLFQSISVDAIIIMLAITAFILSFRFKVSPVYLIGGSLFLGFIIQFSPLSL